MTAALSRRARCKLDEQLPRMRLRAAILAGLGELQRFLGQAEHLLPGLGIGQVLELSISRVRDVVRDHRRGEGIVLFPKEGQQALVGLYGLVEPPHGERDLSEGVETAPFERRSAVGKDHLLGTFERAIGAGHLAAVRRQVVGLGDAGPRDQMSDRRCARRLRARAQSGLPPPDVFAAAEGFA